MERTYAHIDLDERRKIARWRTAKLSVDAIAEKLGRHRSTIFRELKRNRFVDDQIMDLTGYYCTVADQKARERRTRQRKLLRYDHLRQNLNFWRSVVVECFNCNLRRQTSDRSETKSTSAPIAPFPEDLPSWHVKLRGFLYRHSLAAISSTT